MLRWVWPLLALGACSSSSAVRTQLVAEDSGGAAPDALLGVDGSAGAADAGAEADAEAEAEAGPLGELGDGCGYLATDCGALREATAHMGYVASPGVTSFAVCKSFEENDSPFCTFPCVSDQSAADLCESFGGYCPRNTGEYAVGFCVLPDAG